VTYQQDGLWSLYTQSRESGLPGSPQLARWGDTWDLAAGYPIPMGELFPGGRGWKRQLLAAVSAELQRQARSGACRFREDWPRQLRRCFDPQHYYLTEQGLVVFYPMYALAPASEGIPTFLIPYGQAALRPR
jgi:hypothetical protein